MSHFCMPMIIVNMGGEMVYILEQRLNAQKISHDKSQRVLQDVIRTMFNSMFIEELFRPQEVYTMSATRQIFDRLAHSSIMRLNESSMDKLFDLMTMGFKYQLLSCAFPQELLLVTLNHLYQLGSKVEDAKGVRDLVDEVIGRVNQRYATMTSAVYASLKQARTRKPNSPLPLFASAPHIRRVCCTELCQALCRYFSDKRVKVSLFLQDGIQKQDGTIALSCHGRTPPGVDVPGKIVYFDATGGSTGVDSFVFPFVDGIAKGNAAGDFTGIKTHLGANLYAKDAPGTHVDAAVLAGSPPPPPKIQQPKVKADSSATERTILEGQGTQQSTRELNVLANLIGPAQLPSDAFKLNLFPDTNFQTTGSTGGGTPMITIDAGTKAQQSTNRDLVGIMGDMSEVSLSAGAENPDDLLDLLDAANE